MQIKTAVVSVAFVGLCFQGGTVLAAWGDGPGWGSGKCCLTENPSPSLCSTSDLHRMFHLNRSGSAAEHQAVRTTA